MIFCHNVGQDFRIWSQIQADLNLSPIQIEHSLDRFVLW